MRPECAQNRPECALFGLKWAGLSQTCVFSVILKCYKTLLVSDENTRGPTEFLLGFRARPEPAAHARAQAHNLPRIKSWGLNRPKMGPQGPTHKIS